MFLTSTRKYGYIHFFFLKYEALLVQFLFSPFDTKILGIRNISLLFRVLLTCIQVCSIPILNAVKFGHFLPCYAKVIIVKDQTISSRFAFHLVNFVRCLENKNPTQELTLRVKHVRCEQSTS